MRGNKANGNKAALASIMAISVLASIIALPVPVLAANENVFVDITSDLSISGAEPGDTATVPIMVYNVTDLAAGTLRVTCNSSVCNMTDVTTGTLSIVMPNISTPGLAIISAFDPSNGHTGDVTFANLEIEAIGSCGESSPLNITVEVLGTYGEYGEGAFEIPAANISVSNGTLTVLSGPTPTPTPTPTPSHCFIATAAYGTPLHEDIDALRAFRDKYLMTNPPGRTFVKIYYTTSPPIAEVIRENEGLRTIVREGLVKPLVHVSRLGKRP